MLHNFTACQAFAFLGSGLQTNPAVFALQLSLLPTTITQLP